jgi:hypothetical protein
MRPRRLGVHCSILFQIKERRDDEHEKNAKIILLAGSLLIYDAANGLNSGARDV